MPTQVSLWPDRHAPTFQRLNAFMDRCNDVLDLSEVVAHFRLLDSVVIGGNRGSLLTSGIKEIYTDFLKPLQEFEVRRFNDLQFAAALSAYHCRHR